MFLTLEWGRNVTTKLVHDAPPFQSGGCVSIGPVATSGGRDAGRRSNKCCDLAER